MSEVIDLVRARVLSTLRQTLSATQAVDGDSVISDDLGFDSLALMELVLSLEDRFDVSIPLERVARISTVDDLVEVLKLALARSYGDSIA